MATLQAVRQGSASTAKARLKQVSHQPAFEPVVCRTAPEMPQDRPPIASAPNLAQPDEPTRLSVLELRQLLLQTATVYPGWQLVSIQHQSASDVLVAYLIRSQDSADPTLAIREGRSLQIIMDATGDLRIHRPHRRHSGRLADLLRRLTAVFRPRKATSFTSARAW